MANKTEVQQLIDQLNLSSHPEGGYFRETFRSSQKVRMDEQERSAATDIYFLLPAGVCTNWHRVCSDELWHFYKGDPLVLEVIDENGTLNQQSLHNQRDAETDFRGLVPANCWQRAYSQGAYSLVGCIVAPGFEFEDFEMKEPEELAGQYPGIASDIKHNVFSSS